MKKFFGWFCKKEEPKRVQRVYGITEHEYNTILAALYEEWKDAKSRQKSPDAYPTKYMLGLERAIEIAKSIPAHVVAEVLV